MWPFDPLSPWNRPLGTDAVYAPIRSALTGAGFTAGGMNYKAWTVSIWIASPSDPLRKIYAKRWVGSLRDSDVAFIERRIPNAMVPSPGDDTVVTVISSDHSTALEFFETVRLPNGDLQVAAAGEVDLRGDGMRGIVTNGMSLTGGVIRAGELRNGINHVLMFGTSGKMWNRLGPGGRPYVWPARRADRNAMQGWGYGTSGNLYLGSWVAIPPRVNLNALGLETPEGRVLARALQDYGAIGTASGGDRDRIVFRYDYTAYKAGDLNSLLANWPAFKRDLNRLAQQLQVVINSHDDGQAPTLGPTEGIGGGAPRAPFAPDFPSSQGQSLEMVAAVAGIFLVRRRVQRIRD